MTGLVTWMWQGLVVVAATGLALRLLPRLSASTRHLVWWIALAMVLVHPWTPADVPFEPTFVPAPAAIVRGGPAGLQLVSPPLWLLGCAWSVWGAFILWRVAQIVLSLRYIRRLKEESQPFDVAREGRLLLWARTRSVCRHCELRVSDQAASPCALGFRRPVILIPNRLVRELSDAELDLVIAHERAHLVRRDDWLQLLQRGVLAVLGLHPAVALIGRQIALEREAACDDHVVAVTGTARAYAGCLARVATLMVGGAPTTLAPGVGGSSRLLRTRVRRLLRGDWNRTPRIAWWPAVVVAMVLGVVVFASDQAPPVVTFVEPAFASVAAPPHVTALMRADMPRATMSVEDLAERQARARPEPAARPSVHQFETRPSSQAGAEALPTMASRRIVLGSLQPTAITAPAVDRSVEEAAAPSTSASGLPDWSAIGTGVGHAGQSFGSSMKRAGLGVGHWFANPRWTGTRSAGR